MADEAQMRTASFGDEDHLQIIAMVEHLREASLPILGDCSDPNRMALLMTAASMFAGSLLGTLIVVGVARDQDKRRVTESMAKNFRSGIDVGKRRAERVAGEIGGGTLQ